jgi:hypothetical protein
MSGVYYVSTLFKVAIPGKKLRLYDLMCAALSDQTQKRPIQKNANE